MSDLPPCPACKSVYSYTDGQNLVCPECGHEWSPDAPIVPEGAVQDKQIVRDSNGNLLADGDTIATASRKLGFNLQSYYRWRKEYGGMKIQHVKRLKELKKENGRLKKLLAEAELSTR